MKHFAPTVPALLWVAPLLLAGLPREVPANQQNPRLAGTLLQLLQAHADWPPSRWQSLFGYFQDLGLHQIIVQWSVLDDLALYESAQFKSVKGAPLETVLREADRLGMSVQIGLVHDSDYWSHIAQDPPTVAAYFDRLRLRSLVAAKEVAELIRSHPCVTGWYIPGEIDDVSWRDPALREVLLQHVSAFSLSLQKLTPHLPISISTFAQGRSSPAGFEEFWNVFFSRTSVHAVYFQDGVGVQKLDISEVPLYLSALQNAASEKKRRAYAIVELLQQTAGPPINQAAFQAVPAPFERILRQILAVGSFAPDGILGFSVPEYMTPLGGEPAAALFEQYRTALAPKALR